MRFRHSSPALARLVLTTGVCITALGTAAPGQEALRAPLALNSARVTIAGTSNVHDYTASTTTVRLTGARIAPAVAGPAFWNEVVKPGALEGFEIAIAAASLKSDKEGLDKNMHKALKVQAHPDITFRLVRMEPGSAAGTLRATGVLAVAGVEREISLDLATEQRETGLAVKGQVDLLMTDFGITPPKAMLGMLKTNPKVTVAFETLLAIATT